MGSTNSRRVGAVAALATSLTMMGGAAFASSPSSIAGHPGNTTAVVDHVIAGEFAHAATTDYSEPINPGGILGGAYAVVVTTIHDADN